MAYLIACLAVFVAAYTINLLMITVGYHRGLAHGAVQLSPRTRGWVIRYGNWTTGLDPKAWCVMHRRHHAFSDTDRDPHSPANVGITGILSEQLKSYKRVIVGLAKKNPEYTRYAKDLDFELSWLNRKRVWWLPYAVHAAIAVALFAATGFVLLPVCYFLGMMSHPIQGGLVNAFGHASGGRNFDTDDQSRNNTLVAWFVAGEGYQNNHHAFPASAKFSYKPSEVDSGYGACRVMQRLGMLHIRKAGMIPKFGQATRPEAHSPEDFEAADRTSELAAHRQAA